MTKERWIRVGRWSLLFVVAVAGLGVLSACGGEERLSRQEFSDRVQSIDRRESTRFERLAERVMRLKPDDPLPDEVKQGMLEFAGGLGRAADELEALNPPEEAEEETDMLIEAIRQRADGFERAAHQERITLQELEAEGSITAAGEKIDHAFEQLRQEGFFYERPGEHSTGSTEIEAGSEPPDADQ